MSRSCSRSRLRTAFVALGLALLASAARGDGDWRPVYSEDSVSVSERPAPGRALPDFRGEVEIPAEPYEVLAVILDVPAQTEWMWQCRQSRVLREEGDSARLMYQVIDAHWPATDRDVVLHSEVTVREVGRRASVHFTSVDSPLAPPVAGLVRMPHLDGELELEAAGPGRTRVTYTVSADPGGMLPAVFLRETVRESPYDTLVGLRRRVAETRGRYADVVRYWLKRAQ